MKNNKKILFLFLFLVLSSTLASQVFAAGTCDFKGGNPKLDTITGNIKGAALAIGATLAVIGFVVAGILYLTAAGGERLSIAKKALIAAVIGSFLVALAAGADVMTTVFCALLK